MGIFDEAYRQGQKAYDEANRTRKEIAAVFDDLTQQVSKASDGFIRISWGSERPAPTADDPAASAAFRDGIFASIGQWGKRRGLGFYSLTSYGYPVKLEYAGKDVSCANRDELIKALADFLRHPDTGAVLRWLIENQQKD